MKNHNLLRINLMICLIIIVGFVSISAINYQTYKTILEDDIENITKLTSSNIYAEIDNELTKPIFVSQTMANDSFLKEWLLKEQQNLSDPQYAQKLEDYLYAYKVKYNYDSVYTISAKTDIYYFYNGVNKIMSPKNEHDDWYYDFVKSGKTYKLNIDSDEVNHNELTVFIDCRMEDENGEFLGVTGVGVKMSRLQELLKQHESEYKLKAFLINSNGDVQVDTNSENIGTMNVFNDPDLSKLKDKIINNKKTAEIHWYPAEQLDNCVITRYVANMDWYLVIQKNTEPIRQSFGQLVQQDLLVIIFILILLLSASTTVIRRYNKIMVKALDTDALTGIENQQSFSGQFTSLAKENSIVFILDIDHFKNVNDTKGHLFGNKILVAVAKSIEESVGDWGVVARWGGDEFIGIIDASLTKSSDIFKNMMADIARKCDYDDKNITISIGVTIVKNNKNLDYLLEQADQAMYESKEKGGNCCTYSNEK